MGKDNNFIGRDVAAQNVGQAVAMAHLLVAKRLRDIMYECDDPSGPGLRPALREFIALLESQEVPS